MSTELETIIRYDGPALRYHEMEVEELAPALLALAGIIQSANDKFNHDRAKVRVVINADIEQQCFQLKIKFIQTVLEKARTFIDGDGATALKDILEWIGVVGGSGFSLFKILVALGKKKEADTTFRTDASDNATVYNIAELHLHGDVPKQVRELLQDKEIVQKAQQVLKPMQQQGYDSLSFHEADGTTSFRADKDDARAVLALPAPETAVSETEDDVTPMTAEVRVKVAPFEGSAKWALVWAGRTIEATMPAETVHAFQENELLIVPHTRMRVKMEQCIKLDRDGNAVGAPTFTVLEVEEIKLPPKAPKQTEMFGGG